MRTIYCGSSSRMYRKEQIHRHDFTGKHEIIPIPYMETSALFLCNTILCGIFDGCQILQFKDFLDSSCYR